MAWQWEVNGAWRVLKESGGHNKFSRSLGGKATLADSSGVSSGTEITAV